MKKLLAMVLCVAMVLGTMGTVAFAEEADVIVLNAGTYTWESRFAGKTVVAADGEEVILDMTVVTKPGLGGADTSFEGITFEWGNAGHNGLQHSGNLTYTNCVINGQPFLYGESETFENCTFNQTDINQYNVWTYAAKEVKFIGCTFNSAGRCVLVYGDGGEAGSVEFEDTTLNASNAVDGKAAIEIDTSLMTGNATITVDENTTAIGFGAGSKSNNTLWNVKTDPAKKESSAVVSVADETVYAKVVDEEGTVGDIVASVSGAYYSSLQDALKATKDMDTAEVTIFAGEYSIDAFTLGTNVREYPFADNLSIVADGDVTIKLNSETKSYQNGVAYQYFVGGSWYVCGKSIAFDGINFVFEDTNTEDGQTMAEIQTYASESLSYTNCTFDNVSVSPWGDNSTGKTAAATIEGCTFSNIASRSAIHQSKALNLTVANNDFIDVVNGVHISGNELATLTVTGNDFDGIADGSAAIYFGNESWNGVWVGDYSNATITVTGNTSDAALVRNGNESLTVAHIDALSDETANTFESAFTGNSVKFVACIGNTNYVSLADAIDAANNGAVIDLLDNKIEINVYMDSYHKGKSLTFKNGTLDFSYAGAPTALFWLSGNQKLAFEDVNIIKRDVGTERKFMYNLIQIASSTASVSFKDCTIDLDGAYDETNKVGMYSSYIANDGNGTMYFENCDIETEYTNFIYRGGATVINCTYNGFADLDDGDIAGNFILWSANPCVIKNSTINTRQLGFISANGTIAITEDSYVYAERVRHYYAADNANYTEGLLTIDASSTLEAVELDMGLINENSEGVINTEASKVYVQYKKVDVDANGNDTIEDQDKYEIVLVGANNNAGKELINELASADLTFEFVGTPVTGGAMDYFVEPANGVSLTQLGDRYMFNYNGVDKYEETGAAIVIGTITIDGYGSYNLGTKEVTTNAVYATEIKDNIVDGFTPAAGLEINKDVFADDGMVGNITDGEIAVPTRTLKVTIDFPNAIEANVADYQDMKVEITGTFDGVNKTVTYDLGEDMVDGSYVVEDANLVLNNAYTVTVSGAGYRTARYTVTMTTDKTLRFWNNVMDENQVVELGKDSSIAKVTFLAGDIVKDNNINIYDLSAVVSYFGSVSTTENGYAKYDLNRDGVIDSKDVAYVLVSWNN